MDSTCARAFVMLMIVGLVLRPVGNIVNSGKSSFFSFSFDFKTQSFRSLPNQHPCTQPCHAPSACPETEPCMATITLTCPCERIKQFAACGRQASHSSGHQHSAPKCTSECQIVKRNAQLADALGIRTDSKDKSGGITYHEQVVAFGRGNVKFVQVVEKAFAEYVGSDLLVWMLMFCVFV